MKIYKNLTIVGTSHISIESVKEVEEIILKNKPDVVALELDRVRFEALVNKRERRLRLSDIKKIGFNGFLFNLIGGFIEKRLGKIVSVAPGSEMKKAAEVAKKCGAKVALIDQDVSLTLKKISKEITWREKFRFIKDVIKGISAKRIKFDLTKVPPKSLIKRLTNKLKIDYPNLYRILVKERNEIMAKYLYILMNSYNSVVAVVGAGHEEEIIEEIKKWGYLQKKKEGH